MICKYNMIVDFARPQKSNTVIVAENDVDSRQCNFRLLFDKQPFDMTGVVQATVWGVKSGQGGQVYSPATIVQDEQGNNINEIYWVIPADITEDAGVVTLTVTLADNVGASISSFEFYVKVRNALYNEDDFIDDDEKNGLRDLISRCVSAVTAIEEMIAENELPNPYPIRITMDGFDFEYKGESIVEIEMDDVAYLGDAVGSVEVTEDDSAAQVAVEAANSAAESAASADDKLTEITQITNDFESKIPTAEVTKSGSVTTITITDQHGTSTAQVYDGDAGTVETEIRDTVGWTGKNLVTLAPVGNVREINGITFTVRSDGGVSVVGTSTGNAYYGLPVEKIYAGEYITSCGFEGTPDGAYPCFSTSLFAQDGTRKELDYMMVTNLSPAPKTKTIEGTDYLGQISIYVPSGRTVNQILYPMIRKASIIDGTFEPYHETVEEVIEKVDEDIEYIEDTVIKTKNILPQPYPYRNNFPVGTNVIFTQNSDYSITANGSTSSSAEFISLSTRSDADDTLKLKKGTYVFSGNPNTDGTTYIAVNTTVNGSIYRITSSELVGDATEVEFEITNELLVPGKDYAAIGLIIGVKGNKTVTNARFEPMIRLASEQDGSYIPYVKIDEKLNLSDLRTVVAASSDFADFKSRIAAM